MGAPRPGNALVVEKAAMERKGRLHSLTEPEISTSK